MKGTLTDQPLAELIREIVSKGFSGTLRLEHDRVQTAVYFEAVYIRPNTFRIISIFHFKYPFLIIPPRITNAILTFK